MAAYFTKGTLLEQNKEPALSREIKIFTNQKGATHFEAPRRNPQAIPWDQLIELAKKGRIVDECDGKALHEKLRLAKERKVEHLLVDSTDDEPYISSQLAPTLQLTEQMLGGLRFAMRATGAKTSAIAIYRDIMDVGVKVPKEFDGVPVERIQGTYPAQYRSKSLQEQKNTLVVGSCALIHLYRAITENRMQTTCFVTVAGDCIANPANLEVSIGMPLQQALERCGLSEEPRRVVVGGSMTGYAVTDTEGTTINPMTRGILAFREDFKQMNFTCIGCGRCSQVCPEYLSPYYLYKYITARKYSQLEKLDILMCTGCGTCSYVCPAKLDIANVIAVGKREYTALRTLLPLPEAATDSAKQEAIPSTAIDGTHYES